MEWGAEKLPDMGLEGYRGIIQADREQQRGTFQVEVIPRDAGGGDTTQLSVMGALERRCKYTSMQEPRDEELCVQN